MPRPGGRRWWCAARRSWEQRPELAVEPARGFPEEERDDPALPRPDLRPAEHAGLQSAVAVGDVDFGDDEAVGALLADAGAHAGDLPVEAAGGIGIQFDVDGLARLNERGV